MVDVVGVLGKARSLYLAEGTKKNGQSGERQQGEGKQRS